MQGSKASPFSQSRMCYPSSVGLVKLFLLAVALFVLGKDAKPIVSTLPSSWIEICSPHTFEWTREETQEILSLVAYSTYGQGRILAFSSLDFFSNKTIFGLSSLDNKKLIQNLFNWLVQPYRKRRSGNGC